MFSYNSFSFIFHVVHFPSSFIFHRPSISMSFIFHLRSLCLPFSFSCNFMPCQVVSHFPFPSFCTPAFLSFIFLFRQLPPLLFYPSFSILAFSFLAFSASPFEPVPMSHVPTCLGSVLIATCDTGRRHRSGLDREPDVR